MSVKKIDCHTQDLLPATLQL